MSVNTNHMGRYEFECIHGLSVHVGVEVVARANVIVSVVVYEGRCEYECTCVQE